MVHGSSTVLFWIPSYGTARSFNSLVLRRSDRRMKSHTYFSSIIVHHCAWQVLHQEFECFTHKSFGIIRNIQLDPISICCCLPVKICVNWIDLDKKKYIFKLCSTNQGRIKRLERGGQLLTNDDVSRGWPPGGGCKGAEPPCAGKFWISELNSHDLVHTFCQHYIENKLIYFQWKCYLIFF